MSTVYEYWIHDENDEPTQGPYTDAEEARYNAPTGSPWALIAYEYEYTDSELIECSDGGNTWPPSRR